MHVNKSNSKGNKLPANQTGKHCIHFNRRKQRLQKCPKRLSILY